MRRARWKRKNVGRLKSAQMCRFDRRRGLLESVLTEIGNLLPGAPDTGETRVTYRRKRRLRFAFGVVNAWTVLMAPRVPLRCALPRDSGSGSGKRSWSMRLPPRFTEAVSNAGTQFYGAAVYSAPGTSPDLPPHRLARPPYLSKPAQRAGFGHKSGFFSTAAAATFLCQD